MRRIALFGCLALVLAGCSAQSEDGQATPATAIVEPPEPRADNADLNSLARNHASWSYDEGRTRLATDIGRMAGRGNVAAKIGYINEIEEITEDRYYKPNPTTRADLTFPASDWGEFNQCSVRIYPDVPDRAAIQMQLIGASRWTCSYYPLKPREWNKVSVSWLHLGKDTVKKITGIRLWRSNAGRLPQDPEWSYFYVDGFELEKVIPRNVKGWSADPHRIIVSQIGFRPQDEDKIGILTDSHPSGTFQLVDSRTDRIVHEGELAETATIVGKYRIADFSDYRERGRYYLRSGKIRSVSFPIGYRIHDPVVEKSLYFIRCMRSGTETPAHPASHLDDAVREDNGEHVDLAGGWYDASDIRIYHNFHMAYVLKYLALAHLYGSPAYDWNRDGMPDALEESIWGGRLLAKMWDRETGLPYTTLCHYFSRKEREELKKRGLQWHTKNNYWTDNKVGTGDERKVHVPWVTGWLHPDAPSFHLGTTSSGAYLHLIAHDTVPHVVQEALSGCRNHFDNLMDPDFWKTKRRGISNRNDTHCLGLKLENAVAFWKATRNQKYQDLAFKLARELLSRQYLGVAETKLGPISGLFYASEKKGEFYPGRRGYHLTRGIVELLFQFPECEEYFGWYASLKIYAELFLKPMSRTAYPYGLIDTSIVREQHLSKSEAGRAAYRPVGKLLEEGTSTWTKIYSGAHHRRWSARVIGCLSFETQLLAMLLRDAGLEGQAAKYLRWQVGENPFARSLICEVGEDYKRDHMSLVLGYMPGMMASTETVDGVPYLPVNCHYHHEEIYPQASAPYLASASILSNPASFSGTVMNGRSPAGGLEIQVRSRALNRTVESFRADDHGRFEVRLWGGDVYQFDFGAKAKKDLTAISGASGELKIDLMHLARLEIVESPGEVAAGSDFRVSLRLSNCGRTRSTHTIRAHGFQATTGSRERVLTVGPLESRRLSWDFVAPGGNRPYVVMFELDGERGSIVSAVGISRDAERPTAEAAKEPALE